MHLKLLCVCVSDRPSGVRPSVTIKGTVGDDTYGTQQQMRFISFNYDMSSLFCVGGEVQLTHTSCTQRRIRYNEAMHLDVSNAVGL